MLPNSVLRQHLFIILLELGLRKVKVKALSCARLFATPWTIAHQTPLSMEFSRQEYWSGLPFPSPIYMYTYTYTQTHTHTLIPQLLYSFIFQWTLRLLPYLSCCKQSAMHIGVCLSSWITTWLKNRQKNWTDIFPKRKCRWPTGTWKDAQRH